MRLSISNMNKEIVVLIGGPSSGKTTLIEALKEKGHTCYPEVSREVIREAQEQGIEQLFLEKPLLFSELLLEGRKRQFKEALNEEANIVFLDRGIPDVLAYIPNAFTPGGDEFNSTWKFYLSGVDEQEFTIIKL